METLLSVGIDLGTTTTQMVVSKLQIENTANAFSVPRMEIQNREIVYRSAVYETPLLSSDTLDAFEIERIIRKEYAAANITPDQVQTGAVIITGETARKENAKQVLEALSDLAGDFVVATAGPALESVLAAKGAGADLYAKTEGCTVLHMDIGGGTSNLALIYDGQILSTACLNVGGRLVKYDGAGRVYYVSPVLQGLVTYGVGDVISQKQLAETAKLLAGALEMAAGLRRPTQLLNRLTTFGTKPLPPVQDVIISFSGGVADCIATALPWDSFGDVGPLLGQAILESDLCKGGYRLGSETIRATVIGAGCHSAQLSGSTVYYSHVQLPLKNLPVASISAREQDLPHEALVALIAQRLDQQEQVLALPGWKAPGYGQVTALADAIAGAMEGRACYIVLEEDMAKALGHALSLRLSPGAPCLCIDRVRMPPDSYLDVGAPVGPALSVVVKTLILSH